MDSQRISNGISEILKSRQARAFVIACMVLIALALLQASNLTRQTTMCELLEECKVSNDDLHRMQLAFGQAGLSDFQLKDNRLMVPKSEHARYLQAITENNAVPLDLREKNDSQTALNPFLSRSQQLSLERSQKKKQIRDMVVRLPFVEQAWFEMDQAVSRSAFRKSKQAAVISIRPPENVALSDNHVDTVKRMIGGAVAGLELSEIVVIDLSAGFAHQDSNDPSTTQHARFQRIAFEQQRIYESRIKNALQDYPGVEVSVLVDVNAVPQADKVATQAPATPINLPKAIVSAEKDMSDAGANGFASLDEFEPKVVAPATPPPVTLAYHPAPKKEVIEKSYSVAIDVPEHLVYSIYGTPSAKNARTKNPSDHQAALAKDVQKKFSQLESEIVQKVQPVLPKSDFAWDVPITVNMVKGGAIAAQPAWWDQVKTFAIQNWPSAAVLGIGLILLSIVTRKPDPVPSVAPENPDNDQVVLSMEPPQVAADPDVNPELLPEVQLSKLIEKNPNAAAKVIESWIRDAA